MDRRCLPDDSKPLISAFQCSDQRQAFKKDGARAWCVCLSAFLVNILTWGCSFTYGIMFPVLLDEFGEGKAKTAWVGSLATASILIFSPLVAKLIQRLGPRLVSVVGALTAALGLFTTSQVNSIDLMFVTYSLIFGFGAACTYTPGFDVVPQYFDKRLPLAIGLVMAGVGASFVMSPVLDILFSSLGWRKTFLAMGGFACIAGVLAAVFYTPNARAEQCGRSNHDTPVAQQQTENIPVAQQCTEDTRVAQQCIEDRPVTEQHMGRSVARQHTEDRSVAWQHTEDRSVARQHTEDRSDNIQCAVWRNPLLITCSLTIFVMEFGNQISIVHLGRYMQETGLRSDQSATLYLTYGVATTLGRAVSGKICDIRSFDPVYIYVLFASVMGISTSLCPFAEGFTAWMLYFCINGLANGCAVTALTLLTLQCVEPTEKARAMGVFNVFDCAAYGSGPAIGGLLADQIGSYVPVLHMAGGICALSSFVTLLLKCFRPPKEDRKWQARQEIEKSTKPKLIVYERETVL